MGKQPNDYPYKRLGRFLKQLRINMHESISEVSGAVEMDPDQLSDIEIGRSRPSEDILLLLISHFSIKEDEAVRLWELAEFDKTTLSGQDEATNFNKTAKKGVAYVAPEELRISYTDMVHVSVNQHGVIMNFMQGNGVEGQPMIVSRVGMSKDHAKSVLAVLKQTLELNEQKQLPAPDQKQDKQQ
jgi:transcriptional regulator with XRE-family HTH domain